MRKAQKKQAEEWAKQLFQAHDEIGKTIKLKNIPMTLSLLEECQNEAISLGNLIEEAEGGGCGAVRILEEYCEQIYRLHRKLSARMLPKEEKLLAAGKPEGQTLRMSGLWAEENGLYHILGNLITELRVNLDKIKVCLEAVFLPYKASMWDSLESVWRAADSHPGCDAYVIPIPYYDKNADGSFGKMHDESSLYPDDVPVMDYREYDFEKRKPDMIFIHNPYDNGNYVTSVHPFFYSANLKRFTEQLIYIPYYILNEIRLGDWEAVENMEHLCLTPGIIHADRVIVQSEGMRQVYLSVLLKNTKNTVPVRSYWENKILGLGSPKIDKVLETGKGDVDMPQEWLEVIQKPSGEWKKIILYNTSVSALLRYGEKAIQKMERVFGICKGNRENVALLWRPHPLTIATLKSMCPQLLKDFERTVQQYEEEGWGIYDESADLNRALAISDGYYGDASSLVPLCKSVGLPVMIQNVEV